MKINDTTKVNFILPSTVDPINFCGVHDSNLRCLERDKELKITPNQDGSFLLLGNPKDVYYTKKIMEQMIRLSSGKILITHDDIKIISENIDKDTQYISSGQGLAISKRKHIKPKTTHQDEYIQKILMNDLVFGIGPAGTGKTFLAVAAALHEFYNGTVNKIILARPVVEADESLGFLPGSMEEKLDPYVRPLYDAIHDMISVKEFEKMLAEKKIELAPLAYMRGRTLSNAFVILDEAQNTTPNQMKMFLTRLGENSKMVIAGDITQIDLKNGKSGLIEALSVLKNIKEIAVHYFDGQDVVRHGLVQRIINAYEKNA